MEISVWHIIITAITGPILVLGVKEYFDYLKRKQELSLATNKLVLERKLKLAEEAINVWKGQLSLLQIIAELFDRAHENIQIMGGKEFQKLITDYSSQLNELGRKTWEISNAVDLYFQIEQTNLSYDPNKVLSEWVASIQKIEMEIKSLNELLNNTEDVIEKGRIKNSIDDKVELIRGSMKTGANVLRDGITQLNVSISKVKEEVNNQYIIHRN